MILLLFAFLAGNGSGQDLMPTGPDTEKRFPPLKVPPQFKATLFACDPLIEYPLVLSLGPRSNSIFLAHDYMTGLGEKIVRRDEVRLVWLYLALGDRGCDVARPEGDRLALHGGGILRCRPDGSDLHVFSTGLRNIYDIALDDELNVFVRDNENDGGDYMIRVYHSFMGADHGYPYLYRDHRDEALAPLADLGRGSSAGGVAYLERSFPIEYQGALFFCEWGRSIVCYPRVRKGAGFAAMKESEFAAGAPNDPYGFRPTDVIVDRDGSLLVSDWADGQRPKRGRGRVYRIQYEGGKGKPTRGLDSENYLARIEAQSEFERRGRAGLIDLRRQLPRLGVSGRLHAAWVIAREGDTKTLLRIAGTDKDPRVRAQAVRAIADLFDPVLVEHNASRNNPQIAKRLSALVRGLDPELMLEVTVALGRLRWNEAPNWLKANPNLRAPDSTLTHAIIQTLRRSRNWPAVLEWLDAPTNSPLRPIALNALAGQPETLVVDGLIRRFESSQDPQQRREYADLLTRVHRKPGPWEYWGFRPGPRPPNAEPWERTAAIATALDRALADPDDAVRLATLQRMEREKIPVLSETLSCWLRQEGEPESVAAILSSLKGAPQETVRLAVDAVARDRAQSITNRMAALEVLRPPGLNPEARAKSAPERHVRLTQLALAGNGNPVRGREIYLNAEKSGCVKCHRLGTEGKEIGPDLTGAGRRFSRIHIIESILEPSRAIAPAFRNLSIRLKDGQEPTGIRIAETESLLTLADAQGQSHAFKKDQIEELQLLELSIMPEGLEGGLTDAEFADLVAFLAEQK